MPLPLPPTAAPSRATHPLESATGRTRCAAGPASATGRTRCARRALFRTADPSGRNTSPSTIVPVVLGDVVRPGLRVNPVFSYGQCSRWVSKQLIAPRGTNEKHDVTYSASPGTSLPGLLWSQVFGVPVLWYFAFAERGVGPGARSYGGPRDPSQTLGSVAPSSPSCSHAHHSASVPAAEVWVEYTRNATALADQLRTIPRDDHANLGEGRTGRIRGVRGMVLPA